MKRVGRAQHLRGEAVVLQDDVRQPLHRHVVAGEDLHDVAYPVGQGGKVLSALDALHVGGDTLGTGEGIGHRDGLDNESRRELSVAGFEAANPGEAV